MNISRYPFTLVPLPYGYSALEPYIDTQTVILHHNKHLKAYVDNLNKALADYPQYHSWTLEELVAKCDELPAAIRTPVCNNAGGVYNHNFYFEIMTPRTCIIPKAFTDVIIKNFQSTENFQEKFKESALNQFGSGWAWLVCDKDGALKIILTQNQTTPLKEKGMFPIMLIDVWEHAYYLKYQNRRAEYIDLWWNLINWAKISQNYFNLRL